MRRSSALLLYVLLMPALAWAHVGSKDVFQTVHAGPYTLYVTVRTPNVIPGVATVEVRSTGAAFTSLSVTPLPVTGEASKHPPVADPMRVSTIDPKFYTGAVWIMAGGTWQVRFDIAGPNGAQTASVPVVAVPIAVLTMQPALGITLGLLGTFLIVTMAGIVAASVRESRLRPGAEPTPSLRRKGVLATLVSLVLMGGMVLLGGKWWKVEAAGYAGHIFVPAPTHAILNGAQLDLVVKGIAADSDQKGARSNKDYLPDHGHLMHLYAIRQPGMDAAFHLHPELVAPGDFRTALPPMQPGEYRLYGDVVHSNGLPETLQANVVIPAGFRGTALGPEDAAAAAAPITDGVSEPAFKLPDGYTMVWDRQAALTAGTGYTFVFRLLDPEGRPATAMQPYLGMAGHAAFVKTDGTVFAHTHPEGSAAMADVMLADESMGTLPGMEMGAPVGPEVGFPYGFPTPGRYRIFVQMKHAGIVETGVFDAEVK